MRILTAFLLCLQIIHASSLVLDNFVYENLSELQKNWKANEQGVAQARLAGGLEGRAVAQFECRFDQLSHWRCSWDKLVDLDLSKIDRLQLKCRAIKPDAIKQVSLYFKSGEGWYITPKITPHKNWSELTLFKSEFGMEGNPKGWHQIDAIRLSVLPARSEYAAIELSSITASHGWQLDDIGKIAGFQSLKQVLGYLKEIPETHPNYVEVLKKCAEVEGIKGRLANQLRFKQEDILKARRILSEAYALRQNPKPQEFKGIWAHVGNGPRGVDGKRYKTWKETMPLLAEHGINAIFPNLLWSGTAYYPSEIVPVNPVVKKEGDQVLQLIEAAKQHDIEVHLWKVCWKFSEGWLAPYGVSKPFREQGRLQRNNKGEEKPWLCPSDPINQEYELAAIMEASQYEVDGIHLDYIRFPNDGCYCEGCHQRFCDDLSLSEFKHWPQAVLNDTPMRPRYQQWKRDQITRFVRKVRLALKKERPSLKLSAAVFDDIDEAKLYVSQDWKLWIEEGLLDFICTMTYHKNSLEFERRIKKQVQTVQQKVPLYVGLFSTYGPEETQDLDVSIQQILMTRSSGADGFVLFELQEHLVAHTLEFLSRGICRDH